MNGVREWSTIIVLAALAAAVLQYLIPDGAMEKVTRLVIGAFIICSILVPIGRLTNQFETQAFASQDTSVFHDRYQQTVSQQTASAAESAVRTVVIGKLEENGIQMKNVAVNMDTNENGSISITKVFVSLDQRESAKVQETKKLLEQELGLKTEVTADGGA